MEDETQVALLSGHIYGLVRDTVDGKHTPEKASQIIMQMIKETPELINFIEKKT